MRISTEALPKDIDSAVDWISGQIGAAIDKRVAAFEQQERTNPLLASHFRRNFALEFALAKARQYRKSTGRLPKGEEYDALYSFLIPTHRIHGALPLDVKTPFEGRLRDAVGAKWLSGNLVMLNNPQPLFPCDEVRSIFRPAHR